MATTPYPRGGHEPTGSGPPGGAQAGPPFHSRELALSDSHALIREVHAYWQSKRPPGGAPGALPRKADILPWEITPHLGRICLLDVLREPEDFVYRLYGTGLLELVRQELNGKSVRTVQPPSYARLLFEQFRCARDRAAPLVHLICLSLAGERLHYQRLCLPLSHDGGPQVDVLLTYAVTGSWDGWTFAEHCLGGGRPR